LGRRLSHLRCVCFSQPALPGLGRIALAPLEGGLHPPARQRRRGAIFRLRPPISPVRAVKTVTVEGRAPVVRMRYQITNAGTDECGLSLGHTPRRVAITEDTILRIPAKHGIVHSATSPTGGKLASGNDWPILEAAGGRLEMNKLPRHRSQSLLWSLRRRSRRRMVCY